MVAVELVVVAVAVAFVELVGGVVVEVVDTFHSMLEEDQLDDVEHEQMMVVLDQMDTSSLEHCLTSVVYS